MLVLFDHSRLIFCPSLLCAWRPTLGVYFGGSHASWILAGFDQWEASGSGRQQERELGMYYPCPCFDAGSEPPGTAPQQPAALSPLLCPHFLPLLSSPKGSKTALCCWCLGAPSPLVGSLSPAHTSVNSPSIEVFSFERSDWCMEKE